MFVLKQYPGKWYKSFDSFMVSQNFTRSEYDHYVYSKSLNGIFIILVLYVDDFLVEIQFKVVINNLKAHLARTFDMKELGATKKILGI